MSYTIPAGTRDISPEQMRDMLALCDRLRKVFSGAGYLEVSTPTLEYEEVFQVGDERSDASHYRFTDEHGNSLVLKPDMTVPIARMVATNYSDSEVPLRFCTIGEIFRGVRPQQGQLREALQGGIELFGLPGLEGDVEALTLLCKTLESIGLGGFRIGLGDSRLYRSLLADLELPQAEVLYELVARDFVALEREVRALSLDQETTELLIRMPKLRGGLDVLDQIGAAGSDGQLGTALADLRSCYAELEKAGVADRFIFDLGLVRDLGYYTGIIFEVYDPTVGLTLGGGGRYDHLLGRFGRDLAAVGFDLSVDLLYLATKRNKD